MDGVRCGGDVAKDPERHGYERSTDLPDEGVEGIDVTALGTLRDPGLH